MDHLAPNTYALEHKRHNSNYFDRGKGHPSSDLQSNALLNFETGNYLFHRNRLRRYSQLSHLFYFL